MTIRRAVVIEDTDGDRELFVELLRAAGIDEVSSYAACPATFEPALDESTLIVLDLVLGPGADGVQSLEAIAAAGGKRAPIVLVSGNLQALLEVVETYGRALGLNVVGRAEKPVPTDLFGTLIRELR